MSTLSIALQEPHVPFLKCLENRLLCLHHRALTNRAREEGKYKRERSAIFLPMLLEEEMRAGAWPRQPLPEEIVTA